MKVSILARIKHGVSHIKSRAREVGSARRLPVTIHLSDMPKADMTLKKKAAFTIVSKNYMHYALALRESFLRHNKDYRFVIVLMDMYDDQGELKVFSDLQRRGVEIMNFNSLRTLPFASKNFDSMLAKYNILEMNTAIKPFVIEEFFNQGHEQVTYIDPDIYFYASLTIVEEGLKENDFILTPHITEPYGDDKHPSEIDIMRSGAYNLGFIALNRSEQSYEMVRWWQACLAEWCYSRPSAGLFTDQKWMDLLPCLFDKVKVEKNAGLNVAYWNLHERVITNEAGTWKVNGTDLVFFHFSGLPLIGSGPLSKHQNRFDIDSISSVSGLVAEYRNSVKAFGPGKFLNYQYHFRNYGGSKILSIPDVLRSTLMIDIYEKFGSPFRGCLTLKNQITDYLNDSISEDYSLSRLRHSIWSSREDLKVAFRDILTDESARSRYNHWYETSAAREHNIAKPLIADEVCRESAEVCLGINVIGYFHNVIGIAEVARLFYQKGMATGVPLSLFPIKSEAHQLISQDESYKFESSIVESPVYEQSIFYVNADEIANVKKFFPHLFQGKYVSAVWWWEFDDYFDFPAAFDCVDRVIVYSDFVASAVKKAAPENVKVEKQIFPFIQNWNLKIGRLGMREQLGFSDRTPIFLYVFDMNSGFERKNPLALIQAFYLFRERFNDGVLILKVGHASSHMDHVRQIKAEIKKFGLTEFVTLIDESLGRDDLMSLVNCVDAYVSPHRSEGLGLGMLEAMWMGVPVIATRYGGNLEFMREDNSLLIGYQKVPITSDFGPYKQGWQWAEPNVGELANAMGLVVENPTLVSEIASKGRESVQAQFSQREFTDSFNRYLTTT